MITIRPLAHPQPAGYFAGGTAGRRPARPRSPGSSYVARVFLLGRGDNWHGAHVGVRDIWYDSGNGGGQIADITEFLDSLTLTYN